MSKKKDEIIENFNELLEALKRNQQSSNVIYVKKKNIHIVLQEACTLAKIIWNNIMMCVTVFYAN